MPASAVRAFSDPDDYATSIRVADAELTITGRGAWHRPASGGQSGGEAACDGHAEVLPGSRGTARPSSLHPGAVQRDRRVGTDIASMLRGTVGNQPQAILAVAPDESGATRPARRRRDRDNGDRNRDAIRLLAIRTVLRGIPVALRGIAFHDARPAVALAADRCRRRSGISAETA